MALHSKCIFPQYFASQLRYAPLASKFDDRTQLQMLQKFKISLFYCQDPLQAG